MLFGWGCLLWQPLALHYGKRPVYLVSLAGTMATMIWAPHTKTRAQWITSKILQGFFGAPIESLCQVTVADLVRHQLISFVHTLKRANSRASDLN